MLIPDRTTTGTVTIRRRTTIQDTAGITAILDFMAAPVLETAPTMVTTTTVTAMATAAIATVAMMGTGRDAISPPTVIIITPNAAVTGTDTR